jgi:dipeptidyl aminopeptidase/acylaminoacyl peptidase
VTTAPYGSWTSPITAAALVASEHPVSGGQYVGDAVWWLELRPTEGGRYAVRRHGAEGVEDVLPAPWNARTRVHEYGGGAWTVTGDQTLVFAEFADQRLYRLDDVLATPVPLTPEPPTAAAWRYAELQIVGEHEVWCVRERHDGDTIVRDIAAVPLDGSAAFDAERIRSVVSGSHFVANPRVSPDGTKLAWLAWEHPQMPWDGTELRVGTLDSGSCPSWQTLIGSTTESVLQPEWRDDTSLWAITDRSGFWNLTEVGLDSSVTEVAPVEADLGGPLWMLGANWYRPLGDGRLLAVTTFGTDTLSVLDPRHGTWDDIDLGDHTTVGVGARSGDRVLLMTGGARTPRGLREFDLTTRNLTDIRLGSDDLPDAAYLPAGEQMTFRGEQGREVHAVVYRPRNPGHEAPEGELPPFVAHVHGGPTSLAVPQLSASIAYFTSRGIGIVDVNYGGSTGYGREYRNRLRGEWGVVDVEDTITAVLGLAEAGIADRTRLAIQGGSAGGWTVLSALTQSEAFACGVSYFGVAELVTFVNETHDFESRYIDGLIGPLPSALPLYESRAPLSNVDGLSCPVLLLQGLDDPIVVPAQAEMFRDALVAKKLRHAYRAYEGESHGFRKGETIIDATESELSFYGQILGFTPPGIPQLQLIDP